MVIKPRNYCATAAGRLLCLLCFLLPHAPLADAQTNGLLKSVSAAAPADAPSLTSALGGIVVDENDAVVPDASVSVKDATRVVSKEARTSSTGKFLIPQLPPGSYTVSVQHRGFATSEIRNLRLKVHEQLTLKVPLKVGQIGETVTVEAEASVVNTTPDVSTSINRQMVENLPLNGRSLQPLINLTPGVTATKPTFANQGQFSAGGQRASSNYFIVDGVSANIGVAAGAEGLGQSGAGSLPSFTALGTTHALLTVDALQEFKVLTSTFAPEMGRTPGAQVVIQTRGGTNKWRGSLFEYFRHGALDAQDWFANSLGLKPPPLRQHDFGGVVGGPIMKNRTFFFASYEGLRAHLPSTGIFDVPSVGARESAPEQLRPFLDAFPVPNGGETANGLAKFSASYGNSAFVDNVSLRLDQQVSNKLTLFARYSFGNSETETRGVYSSPNTILQMAFNAQTITAGATYSITPKITNEFRANYSRTLGGKYFQLDELGGAEPLDDRVAFPSFASQDDSLFSFSLGGNSSFFVGRDAANYQRQLNLVDNLSIFTGSHQLKFGVDYRRLTPTYGQWKYKQNAYFDGVAGALSAVASSVAVVTQDRVNLLFTNLSAYAQDTWKANHSLSLTYGLRWEFNPPPAALGGQVLYTVQGLDNPAALTLAPAGARFYQPTYTNFAPRVGVAYQLSGRQGRERVLRGGFGVYYDLGAGPLANSATSFPYERRRVLAGVPYPLSPEQTTPLPFSLSPPVSHIQAADPHLRLPLTMQWNVTLEQALGDKRSLSVSYVGAAGHRLLRLETLYNPNPDFSQVLVTTNGARSSYRALEVQFQRRFSRNLQSLFSYTWSRSIDNASSDSSLHPPAALIDPRLDLGPSDFDVRHTFAAAITYDLPKPSAGSFGSSLLGHWSVDAIIFARSAAPVDVFYRRDLGFGPFNFRPDVVPGVPLYLEDPAAPGGRVINRAAFGIPDALRQGRLGRNALRGFPFSQIDLSLHRRFPLTERVKLQLRADFFNIFNKPNFSDPVSDLSSGLFGRSTSMFGRSLGSSVGSVGLSPVYQSGGPRSVQLSLKLGF
ncbi:MAG TPA: carboxypeptidase regulatory-like domain-containing protein [Pyrinomonadaceae bacterium]|jgi:hypothetical protein